MMKINLLLSFLLSNQLVVVMLFVRLRSQGQSRSQLTADPNTPPTLLLSYQQVATPNY